MKKVLVLTPYGVNSKIRHAGGKTSTYYFTSLANNSAIELTFFVLYVRSKDYDNFKLEFARSGDISLSPERNFFGKLSNYFFYKLLAKWLRPLLFEYHHTNGQKTLDLGKALGKAAKNNYAPDVVICDFGDFLLQVHNAKEVFPDAKYVAFAHDYNYKHKRRLYADRPFSKILLDRFFKKEKSSLQAFDLVLPHSSADASAIIEECEIDVSKVKSIVPYFDDYYKIAGRKCSSTHNNTLVYYGAMERPQNYEAVQWFLDNVWQDVLKLYPLLQFVVIGSGLSDKNKQLFLGYKQVEVVGFVQDPSTYFVNALCTAVPLQVGSGIKVKVLEAMSIGLPVLTNEIGIEGIEAEHGTDFLFCKTPQDYLSAISRLYTDLTFRENVINSSLEFINGNFNKERSVEIFNSYIENL
nr:glycosyltransferase [uncultured Mucilaginibacter sp.]